MHIGIRRGKIDGFIIMQGNALLHKGFFGRNDIAQAHLGGKRAEHPRRKNFLHPQRGQRFHGIGRVRRARAAIQKAKGIILHDPDGPPVHKAGEALRQLDGGVIFCKQGGALPHEEYDRRGRQFYLACKERAADLLRSGDDGGAVIVGQSPHGVSS